MVRQTLVSAISEQAALYKRLAFELKEQVQDIAVAKDQAVSYTELNETVNQQQLMNRRALQRSKTVRAAMNKFWKALEAHTIAGAYVPKELYMSYNYKLKRALFKEEMDNEIEMEKIITSEMVKNDEDEDEYEDEDQDEKTLSEDEDEAEKLEKAERKAAHLAAKTARLAAKEEEKEILHARLHGSLTRAPSAIDLEALRVAEAAAAQAAAENERIAKEEGVLGTSHELQIVTTVLTAHLLHPVPAHILTHISCAPSVSMVSPYCNINTDLTCRAGTSRRRLGSRVCANRHSADKDQAHAETRGQRATTVRAHS